VLVSMVDGKTYRGELIEISQYEIVVLQTINCDDLPIVIFKGSIATIEGVRGDETP